MKTEKALYFWASSVKQMWETINLTEYVDVPEILERMSKQSNYSIFLDTQANIEIIQGNYLERNIVH